jgi:hypothetical protein
MLLSCMNIDWLEDDVDDGDGDIRNGGGVCCGVEDFRGKARRNVLLLPPLILDDYLLKASSSDDWR